MLTPDVCVKPVVQRVLFRDADTVLGFVDWLIIDIQNGFDMIHMSLHTLQEDCVIETQNIELTAQMLLGAIIEAAHYVAVTDNKVQAVREAKRIMRKLLSSLPEN